MTPLPVARPLAEQPTIATRVWDVLLKLSVAAAGGLLAWAIATDRRVTEAEATIRENGRDLRRLEAADVELTRKFDRIIDGLDTVGNRLTRIETKLENR